MIAALHYGRSLRGSAEPAARAPGARLLGADSRVLAAMLRTAAATLVAAMLLGAPSGRARPLRPLVALDASASWTGGARARRGRLDRALRRFAARGDDAPRGGGRPALGDRATA